MKSVPKYSITNQALESMIPIPKCALKLATIRIKTIHRFRFRSIFTMVCKRTQFNTLAMVLTQKCIPE